MTSSAPAPTITPKPGPKTLFAELEAAFRQATTVDPELSPVVQRIVESADARCACCAHGKRGLRVITGDLAKVSPITLPPVRARRTLA